LQKKVEEKNKQLNEMMQNASDNIKLMIDTLHEPLLILDKELRVTLANINFYKTFKLEENKTKSQSIYTIWEGKVSKDLLQKLLEDNLYDSDYACDFNIDYSFGKNKIQKIRINVRRINYTGLDVSYIFLAITFDDNTGENSND
jgi:nitrogen-specific signal transduction histidine kinase